MSPPDGQDVASELEFRHLAPDQLADVVEMLRRCSRSALFRRFHGFSDGVAHARRLVERHDHATVAAWAGVDCIGLGTLGAGPGGYDLGVLVEDRWQRRRVGSELLAHLVAWARSERIDEFRADVRYEDGFILPALARVGTLQVEIERGLCSVRVVLASAGGRPAAEEGGRA